ncbi:MAG: FtsX-like permease family protein [Bacteroidia bacterium]|nr:FtsX-like permease family protein [Bacteroidia bacterium]
MTQPPRWADRFLEWYCRPELLEEIQGDAHELYRRNLRHSGKRSANMRFVWDIVRFLRWSNVRFLKKNSYRSHSSIAMIRNYLIVGLRNMLKARFTSFTNIFGLAIAIGFAITVFIFVDYQYNVDSFHTRASRIYQVINEMKVDNDLELWGDSPFMLAPTLKADNPVVSHATRVEYQSGNFIFEERVFNELIWFTDADFMTMFDFPVKYGDREALRNKNQIVISNDIAKKYFGDRNPIGQQVSIKYANQITQTYLVGAVADKFPENASFTFNVLVDMENFFDLNFSDAYTWRQLTDATFVELAEGHTPDELASLLAICRQRQNKSDSRWTVNRFEMVPLTELALRNHEIDGPISNGGHPAGRVALSVVSLLLLVLACSNYMNIALASASRRLKEIALRKVLGSARRGIVNQFLVENLLICTFALVLGGALSYFLFLPGFNATLPITIPFAFSSPYVAVGLFVALLLTTGLASGAYPAVYIARFQPVVIFRGREKFGRRNTMSKLLLTFQFVMAVILIVGSFIFTSNSMRLNAKDWGYDRKHVVAVPIGNPQQYEALRAYALTLPDVIAIAGSEGQIGRGNIQTTFDHHETKVRTIIYGTEPDYMKTLGLRLKEGRFLQGDGNTRDEVVINEQMARKMGWANPLGETFRYDSITRHVVGVVEDFNHDSFYDAILPAFFVNMPSSRYLFISFRTRPGKESGVERALAREWKTIAPDDPFSAFFQEDVFEAYFRSERANITIIVTISVISILLACIGLFGLVSFTIQQRRKEFSIRKVLGAGVFSIFRLVNADYLWVLLVAFLLGAPVGFWLMQTLIASIYPDPEPIDAMPFLLAIGLLVATVLITISSRLIDVVRENPAETLKSE